jgi:hypothetical protein
MSAQPSNRTIVGVAVLLFGAVLLGVGIHHLIATGTCSSTGYSADYGPVPTCPSGTGWWMMFLFVGIFAGLFGGLAAGASSPGLIIGAIFSGIGFGSLSILLDSHASSGSQTFGALFGGLFALFGAIGLIATVAASLGSLRRSSLRPTGLGAAAVFGGAAASAFGRSRSKEIDPILGAWAASRAAATPTAPESPPTAGLPPASPAAAPAAGTDRLDQVAKLADLHQRGVLTDEEFAHEKAKILGL